MINIKSQSTSLNLQTDTDSLDRAYFLEYLGYSLFTSHIIY